MSTSEMLRLAWSIDPTRAAILERETPPTSSGRVLGILLGSCFPPLTPAHGWQFEALERIAHEGHRAERQRAELLGRARLRTAPLAGEGAISRLRRWVWEEKARIALRELLPAVLGGADVATTARELSGLADAAFEIALEEAAQAIAERHGAPLRSGGMPSSMVVLGMGKLGGLELNAGSDVDVVFIYDTDDGQSQLSLHDHWTRVARRAVSSLESASEDGMIWRVDLRLRPEGSQGAITNSVAATERYYETWGRLWERAALLRSRTIAGDFELGRLVEREIVLPFVFRRDVDPTIATGLAELVERSRAELSPDPRRDLKLGPGGIREAEFFIQALQLIWGGREPSLRVTGSLPALARLSARGFVTDREARDVSRAYVLLRRLEHRIQWMTGLQTHLLPERELLAKVARSLGYDGAPSLLKDLEGARSRVAALFGSLAPARPRPAGRHQALVARLVDSEDRELEATVEQTFGTGEIVDHLRALARHPDGLLGARTQERAPEFVDRLLDALAGASDVEQAARFLRAFIGRFSDPTPYVSLLAEQPSIVQALVTALGASAFVGEAIVSRPDLADVILFELGAPPEPAREIAAELAAAHGDDPRDALVSALRRAKRRIMVHVAAADLAGSIETRETTRLLSELAEQVLVHSVDFELQGNPRGLAVIAMGKLGGRDIGYGSDLDVIFIYDPHAAPDPEEAPSYFVKRAQRIIRLVSEPHPAGPGYELDTRLRPSGSHGLLVTSLTSFAAYHGVPLPGTSGDKPVAASSGAPWERQALLRARAVAGDPELGRAVIAAAETAAYEGGAPPVEEMHRLRLRMQHELGRERDGRYDLKTGRGGLLDVEFATQWLQMRHGADPAVRTTDTLVALDVLHERGYLERPDYDALRDGYGFLRRLEQRLHVLHGTSSTVLDSRGSGLSQLARRMGLQDAAGKTARDRLLDYYRDVTSDVRETYQRVLGLPSDRGD